MEKENLAIKYFLEGYNCAASIVLAFKDEIGLEVKDIERITCNLGGGIARLRDSCGCISGMAIVLGCIYGKDKNDIESKSHNYQMVQELALEFKDKYKSIICSELLNIKDKPSSTKMVPRDKNYYETRPCKEFIGYMAKLIDKKLNEQR